MSIAAAARELGRRLAEKRLRVVFAESCTGGLVSAALARIPGISDWHCGSAVTYRTGTKVDWLGVSQRWIERYSPVCERVARQMAVNVLAHTAEADLSASVTGHLGPKAPVDLDGVVYVGLARRRRGKPKLVTVQRLELRQRTRCRRQQEAAELVLRSVSDLVR